MSSPNDNDIVESKPEQESLLSKTMQSFMGSDAPSAVFDKDATPSLFNCESQHGKCRYFYPKHFFVTDEKSSGKGVGSDYYHIYEHFIELKEQGKLWMNMPRVGSPSFSYNEESMNPITGVPFCRHNITFIHVHKAGGTTIMTSFKNKRTFYKMKRNPLYDPRKYKPKMRLNDAYLQTVTKYKARPDEWTSTDHVLFAFMRDPLDRFISSIGQAMGATGSSSNKVGKMLQKECIEDEKYSVENAQHVIECCINFVKTNGYEIELHFTPQAIEIAFATQMHSVPVSVFQFEESYKSVVAEMGIDPDRKERDGSKKGYRKQDVLTSMSRTDYTDDLKKQVCELYKVDVIMARTLGWAFECCEEFF